MKDALNDLFRTFNQSLKCFYLLSFKDVTFANETIFKYISFQCFLQLILYKVSWVRNSTPIFLRSMVFQFRIYQILFSIDDQLNFKGSFPRLSRDIVFNISFGICNCQSLFNTIGPGFVNRSGVASFNFKCKFTFSVN